MAGCVKNRLLVGGGDFRQDFLAEDWDLSRRIDADLHSVAIDAVDADLDCAADHDRFVDFAGEDEHGGQACAAEGVAIWPSRG